MIKNNNKSQKEIPIAPDIQKHKKKKEKKDKTPWNKHKHKYNIVLLECAHQLSNHNIRLNKYPSKVCTICGRVDSVVKDEKYYVSKPLTYLPYLCYEKELSEEALKLPVWHINGWLDKQAKEGPLQYQEK